MYAQLQVKIYQHDEKGLLHSRNEFPKYKTHNIIVHFKNTKLDDHLDEDFKSLAPLVHQLLNLPDSYVLDGADLILVDTFEANEATVDITV